ncbi:quinon protein alcohol dehydrogenase-like superfamily [Entophlyctis helioformis]|nr:quinon protein alcohol dehydrogenase-like superfamily [Entophlyctis helioformis]
MSSSLSSAHRSHPMGYPVFSIAFTPSENKLLVGGGGGASRAGVKNAVTLLDIVTPKLDLTMVSEHLLSKEDDGCMNIAVHPREKAFIASVNSPEAIVKAGNNKNGRVFLIQKSAIRYVKAVKTLDSLDTFDHQKVARFSSDGKLLCTGSTDGKFCIWSWPTLEHAFPPQELGAEISDIHLDAAVSSIGIVTPTTLRLLDTTKAKTRWELPRQTVGTEVCDFRALRFGTKETKDVLFVVLNAKSRKGAFIQKYDLKEKKLISTTQVSPKPITAFALSTDGSLLAFGSSDLSVTVLTARSLTRVMRIADAHGFPVTSLDISHQGTFVASGSADGTCMVAEIPRPGAERPASSGWCTTIAIMIMAALFVLLTLLAMLSDDPEGHEL